MKENKENLIGHTYFLLKEIIPVLNKFPRSYKFSLGDRIQNHISVLLEIYINAYYSPLEEKKSLLKKANIKLEIIRHYIRLGYDLGLYTSTKYHLFANKLNEIGKMTGGWLKSLKK